MEKLQEAVDATQRGDEIVITSEALGYVLTYNKQLKETNKRLVGIFNAKLEKKEEEKEKLRKTSLKWWGETI